MTQKTFRRKGCHLTWSDRLTIEKMLRRGYSKPEIARYIGVHHSTIYDECKRGEVELLDRQYRTYKAYSPEKGAAHHETAKKNMEKGLKIGKDHQLAKWLIDTISSGYSPAAACSMLGKTPETTFSCTLCRQTVYKYIDNGDLWPLTNKKLRYKGSRKRSYNPVRRASKAAAGDSIERRPDAVKLRKTPGDWEMDSVEGKKSTSAALLVLTERVTRREIMIRMEHKTAANVVAALDRLECDLGPQMFRRIFRSITVDNGTEFSDCNGMETSCFGNWKRTHLYYCHPRCPGERGSNEKQNQLIRWHFPKGTSFDEIDQEKVQKVENWLNNYPRKILEWRCSEDLYQEFISSIG